MSDWRADPGAPAPVPHGLTKATDYRSPCSTGAAQRLKLSEASNPASCPLANALAIKLRSPATMSPAAHSPAIGSPDESNTS